MYSRILINLIFCVLFYVGFSSQLRVNDRPIIGILSQEISYHLRPYYPNHHSYIAASYVKLVEGAGARVVPIWIGKPKSYYEDILSKVNGVLFPGGNTWFNQTKGYAYAGDYIYQIAKQFNERNDYFPILGICLGFELLTYLEANKTEHRDDCNSLKQNAPLDFSREYHSSKLFRNIPEDIRNILASENVTANSHRFCVTRSSLKRMDIDKSFTVTSSSKDWDGFEFIASIEHVNYPFYGIQFHPEKNIYEWNEKHNYPHGLNATKAARYFADFFVNEARRNTHSFNTPQEEWSNLIYNYDIFYTAKHKSVFMQSYFFE